MTHLREEVFGRDPAGRSIPIHTLTGENGFEARVTTYGATLVSLVVPDRDGGLGDVVLGFEDLAGYLGDHPFFGCIVGRFANRISGGTFPLDGGEHHLPRNDHGNHLHGGELGFGRRIWTFDSAGEAGSRSSLTLSYLSRDGEEGYPGRLHARVTYSVDGSEMAIGYEATCDGPTIVNLTNHSYFNLACRGTTLGHELRIDADQFLPIKSGLIPTGELRAVAGTPMDFRIRRAVGSGLDSNDPQLSHGGGYDHNWVLTPGEGCRFAAELYEPVSGRRMEVSTTQPGLQFYGGQSLAGRRGKGGMLYESRGGLCLETQHFPDSPNHAQFPSTVLRPGEKYRHRSVYRFSVR